jgi:hypothetical protein
VQDSTVDLVSDLEHHLREVVERRVAEVEGHLKKLPHLESLLQTHSQGETDSHPSRLTPTELKRTHALEISIEAVQVQVSPPSLSSASPQVPKIQELRDQHGVSLTVPLSSIVLNLEKKISGVPFSSLPPG